MAKKKEGKLPFQNAKEAAPTYKSRGENKTGEIFSETNGYSQNKKNDYICILMTGTCCLKLYTDLCMNKSNSFALSWLLCLTLSLTVLCFWLRKTSLLSHMKAEWKPLWNKKPPPVRSWQRSSLLLLAIWRHHQSLMKSLLRIHGHQQLTLKCWSVQLVLRLEIVNRGKN